MVIVKAVKNYSIFNIEQKHFKSFITKSYASVKAIVAKVENNLTHLILINICISPVQLSILKYEKAANNFYRLFRMVNN